MTLSQPIPGAVFLLSILVMIIGCSDKPGNSTHSEYQTAADRTEWMDSRIRSGAPSPMLDTHFLEKKVNHRGSHMLPGYSVWWLFGKIEIDPKDAPRWIARTTPTAAPLRWERNRNPLHVETDPDRYRWSMPPEDFDDAVWYDPVPLFGKRGDYQAGYLAITKSGKYVYVWQHWR